MTTNVTPYVLVIGSANLDVSVSAAVLPLPGETVIGNGAFIALGGKGANQAVAAAACGAATHFVGRVGADAFGRMIQEGLRRRGVHTEELREVDAVATGVASISVEDSGANCIIVVPGANATLTPADLDVLEPLVRGAALLVMQCEIPLETVYRGVELAAAAGRPVILNPAPARAGLDLSRIARHLTYLVPNETEAAQIAGRQIETVQDATDFGNRLIAQGIDCVIVTLGAQGCVAVDAQSARHYPGHRVAAIDTTGAGDAFVGCLAAGLATGRSRDESIRRAVLYSALSTTQRGAEASYPRLEEFERAFESLK